MKLIPKPGTGEFDPYAIMYIRLLPDDGLVLQHLKENFKVIKDLMLSLPEERLLAAYAKDKWSIKETLVHIMDDERIYAYRALRIARNDKTALPGFEQDDYVPHSRANERSIQNILDEYQTIRAATISLFDNLWPEDLLRTGTANNHEVSVRALAYHIAGHELHHLGIIRGRYLAADTQ